MGNAVTDWLFVVVTLLVPKAGAVVGGMPLTLSLLLFALVVLRSPNDVLRAWSAAPFSGWVLGIFLAFGTIALTLAAANGTGAYGMSRYLAVLSAPAALVVARRLPVRSFERICTWACVLLAIYAASQLTFGVLPTNVPGLTSTYGQDLAQKMIGFDSASGQAQKAPATYQNGNAFGLFAILGTGFLMSAASSDGRWSRGRVLGVVAGLFSVMVCGSRSVQLPSLVLVAVMVWTAVRARPRSQAVLLAWGALALIVVTGALLAAEGTLLARVWDRVVTQTLADPSASGRTEQWSALWREVTDLDPLALLSVLLVGGLSAQAEGAPVLLVNLGLVVALAFFWLLLAPVSRLWHRAATRPGALAVLVGACVFAVDSAMYYPPSAMIVFLFIGMLDVLRQRACLLGGPPRQDRESAGCLDEWASAVREDAAVTVAVPAEGRGR